MQVTSLLPVNIASGKKASILFFFFFFFFFFRAPALPFVGFTVWGGWGLLLWAGGYSRGGLPFGS